MPPVSGPAWPILTVTTSSTGAPGGGGLGRFGGLLRFFLAAAVDGDERGRDERQAELARHVHGGPPCWRLGETGEVKRETEYYCLSPMGCQSDRPRRRAASSGCRPRFVAARLARTCVARRRGGWSAVARRAAAPRIRAARIRTAGPPHPNRVDARQAAPRATTEACAGRAIGSKSWEYASRRRRARRRRIAVARWWSALGGAIGVAHHQEGGRKAASKTRRAGRRSSSRRPTSPSSRASRCRAGCRCRARCSRCARRPSRPRCRATSARSPCAKATPCRPGSCSRAIDTADLEAKLIERQGAARVARRRSSRWPRRRCRPTRSS